MNVVRDRRCRANGVDSMSQVLGGVALFELEHVLLAEDVVEYVTEEVFEVGAQFVFLLREDELEPSKKYRKGNIPF